MLDLRFSQWWCWGFSLLQYDTASLSEWLPMFQRNAVPSSGLRGPRSNLLSPPDPEDDGTMTLQNIRNHSPNDTALYSRRPKSSIWN
jgi:hypothetical protein